MINRNTLSEQLQNLLADIKGRNDTVEAYIGDLCNKHKFDVSETPTKRKFKADLMNGIRVLKNNNIKFVQFALLDKHFSFNLSD